jgi:hypothetical protein
MNLINCNHKVFATAITIRLNAYFWNKLLIKQFWN